MAGDGDKAVPAPPIPQDRRGWRVAPAPDGRGTPDEEVRRIVDGAHDEVTELLTEHRAQLDGLTHALLKAETLDAPDAYAAAGVVRSPALSPRRPSRRAASAAAG